MMNANNDQRPVSLGTEAFLTKWMPQALTTNQKAEFRMDIERLVLARTLEIDRHRPGALTQSDDFDWSGDETIAVKRVSALAVYKSDEGDIVLRQEGPEGGEDTLVVIPLSSAPSVIDAIQQQFRESVFLPVISRRPER